MPEPSLSIIIPDLHSPVLGDVLGALMPQVRDCPAPVDVRVVGIDRFGVAASTPGVIYLETPSPVSPAVARNLGAGASREEDLLIFLDADCVPQPGWLDALMAAEFRWPQASAISGAMLPDGDTFVQHCGQVAGFHEHLVVNRRGPREMVASFSLLVRPGIWRQVGGLDETFTGPASEDTDFAIRVTRLGGTLYFEPEAAVYHKPSRNTWAALWKHAVYSGSQSIRVRLAHDDVYAMPRWSRSKPGLRLLSIGIGLVRTFQIYSRTPHLWRYWRCLPWVFLSKVAWCWGAANGLDDVSGG